MITVPSTAWRKSSAAMRAAFSRDPQAAAGRTGLASRKFGQAGHYGESNARALSQTVADEKRTHASAGRNVIPVRDKQNKAGCGEHEAASAPQEISGAVL
jgi:hypothetical protein